MTRLMHPSEIRYCQDSISSTFSNGQSIYDVLEDISAGRTSLSEIPKIRVAQEDGLWYTLGNRRLWVFKSLEERGQCGAIRVRVVDYIPDEKFTTDNNGQTNLSDIPKIKVARKDNKWFALDNRRLWLFKALQNRGKCGKIHVEEVNSIPANKFTTKIGGTSVRMRSDTGPDSDDDFMFGGYDSYDF